MLLTVLLGDVTLPDSFDGASVVDVDGIGVVDAVEATVTEVVEAIVVDVDGLSLVTSVDAVDGSVTFVSPSVELLWSAVNKIIKSMLAAIHRSTVYSRLRTIYRISYLYNNYGMKLKPSVRPLVCPFVHLSTRHVRVYRPSDAVIIVPINFEGTNNHHHHHQIVRCGQYAFELKI